MASLAPAVASKINTKSDTTEFFIKPTSPTLVEFPNKISEFPEWRLKLQNAVRTRKETVDSAISKNFTTKHRTVDFKNNSEITVDVYENIEQKQLLNPTLERALQRIEKSRALYANIEAVTPKLESLSQIVDVKPAMAKTYEFRLPKSKVDNLPVKPIETPKVEKKIVEETITEEQPMLFDIQQVEEDNFIQTKHPEAFDETSGNLDEFITKTEARPKIERYKTNKLPPLSEKIAASFEKIRNVFGFSSLSLPNLASSQVDIKSLDNENIQFEDFDDIPQLSVRFTSGLFDFLIGGFLSLILLSPFMLMGGQWFSVEGLFGFVATCAIVMFIYLTTSVGLLGKTIGMTIFQLEMVDIETNDLPSFHQSAVSASVYLLSIALGGLGFLTVYLNSELRAAHDLLSNTIVVKEI